MPDARPLLLRDARFREHREPPGHPERATRLDAIDTALEPILPRLREATPRDAQEGELLSAHARDYVDALLASAGRAARLDADTYLSPRSVDVARLAAGAASELAREIATGTSRTGFALVRPPGHHAEPSRGMGFCLFNNVAVAVNALRREAGVERIAIVDWDVHHGNGTQARFQSERDVLFVSLHQFPFYPGTGAANERGDGAGEGGTLNLPLPAGCGDTEYVAAFDRIVLPVLQEFHPEVILVSAGFDAHTDDPLGGMSVSTDGFRAIAELLLACAADTSEGRVGLLLEGGYDLAALGDSVAVVLDTLCAPRADSGAARAVRGAEVGIIDRLREAHSIDWHCLRSRAFA